MKLNHRWLGSAEASLVATLLVFVVAGSVVRASAVSCTVAAVHAGMTFPVQHLGGDWSCRLAYVIDHPTTANSVGPLRAAMDLPSSTPEQSVIRDKACTRARAMQRVVK